MDESFELRVKRLFGSHLFDTVPKSAFPSSSWSVASGEVERREWNRERGEDPEREDIPCASAFDEGGCFSKKFRSGRGRKVDFEADPDDLDDDEKEEGKGEDAEEREIRSSVGLDPTLDNEDEEDEYDKAAFFKEDADERVYMRDVKDRGPHLSYYSIISDPFDESFEEINPNRRDPRADHYAAMNRINEDKEAAITEPHVNTNKPATDLQAKITGVDVLRPILKRKEGVADPRPKKRVRFDPGCKDNYEEVSEEVQDFHMVPQSMETAAVPEGDSTLPQETTPAVPDYIKNPSKYTRYTFDSSDDFDDRANRSAFEDFRNLVKQSKPENLEPEFALDRPNSIPFTPQRKKGGDPMSVDDSLKISKVMVKEPEHNSVHTMGIAAGEDQENDACEMEEDDIIERNVNTRKVDRRYRSKASASDSA